MTKAILLNGPIGCGKTEATQRLMHVFPELVERRAKDKLFELTMAFFNIDADEFWRIYSSRKLKETPLPYFTITQEAAIRLGYILKKKWENTTGGVELSCREAMIYVSECVCKPTFGKDYFGKCRAENCTGKVAVIDDSAGFPEEIPPLIDKVGMANILMIRVLGRGTFAGDSRRYIDKSVIKNTVDIPNGESLEEFLSTVTDVVDQFLNW